MADVSLTTQGRVNGFAYDQSDLDDLPSGNWLACVALGSSTKPLGSPSPIYKKNPAVARKFDIVDTTLPPPELGELPITEKLKRKALIFLEELEQKNCPTVFLIKIDDCGRPDDLESWDSVFIVEAIHLNNFDTSDLSAQDSEEEVTTSGTVSVVKRGRVFPLLWAEKADTQTLAEVLDIEYCDEVNCGNCGQSSAGCDKIYALQAANAASPGLGAQLLYSADGGNTWTAYDIVTLGGTSANKFACVGNYIVVVSNASGSLHYAKKTDLTTWFEVTTGFTDSPNDVYAQSPGNVLFAADGGYIFQASNFKTLVVTVSDNSDTVQNLNRIHGAGDTIVAVGNSNVVKYSINNGASFALLTGPNVGVNLTSVWVVSDYRWYIGCADGTLWYTEDRGATWTQRTLEDQANILQVLDINFGGESGEQGALALEKTSSTGNYGEVYRSISGGREWYRNASAALANTFPDSDYVNAVSVCGYNSIAAGGLASDSADGIIAIAKQGDLG